MRLELANGRNLFFPICMLDLRCEFEHRYFGRNDMIGRYAPKPAATKGATHLKSDAVRMNFGSSFDLPSASRCDPLPTWSSSFFLYLASTLKLF